MASTINPNNIDTAYPIAGQDNDSQGFRDNFTNTSTNLGIAKDEITELQDKAILKSAITGTTLVNDMNGAEIANATIVGTRLKVADYGNSSASAGSITLDASAGTYHKLVVDDDTSINFTGFAPTGEFTEFYLEIFSEAGTGFYEVTMLWPGQVVQEQRVRHYNTVTESFTFAAAGTTYIYKITSTDAGSKLILTDLARDHNIFSRNILNTSEDAGGTPLTDSLVGRPGDVGGMTTYDAAGRLYVCTANWDGTTEIWNMFTKARATVPAAATGDAGDVPGMVAGDGSHIYICHGYYDGASSIWTRTATATW